jgi:hypothetical protein
MNAHHNSLPSRSRGSRSAAVALAALVLISASAQAGVITISGYVKGMYQPIGKLTATLAGANESAVFQLDNAFKYLMMDPGCQFRFYQIITGDATKVDFTADAYKWGAGFANSPTVPFVDPPNGGYKYQSSNGVLQDGGDKAPFYENDDPYVATYGYLSYSSTFPNNPAVLPATVNNLPVHAAGAGANQGVVRQWDAPGPANVNFTTYITFTDKILRPLKEFIVLGGFSWTTTAANTVGGEVDIPSPTKAQIQIADNALRGDGFATLPNDFWLADGDNPNPSNLLYFQTPYDLATCPEPSTFVLCGLGVALVGIYRLRDRDKKRAG